ncbi:MAG: YgjV family protein [Candidatus Gracilibacteria bacterium]
MLLENINLPEIVGVFALIFIVLSFLETNDRKMFLLLAIGSLFYSIHFWGLGLITASIINFFDALKNIAVTKYKKNKSIFLVFAVVYAIIGIKTGNGELMPYLFTLASILSLYAAFFLKGITLRMVYFTSFTIQLIYTIVGNSLSGSIINLLFLLSITSSIYLLYKRRGFLGKIRYARFLLLKNLRRFLGYRYGRVKFLR